MKGRISSGIRLLIFLWAAVIMVSSSAGGADYVIIQVMHRPAQELVEAVRAILSPGGVVIPDTRNNTLVVMDDPAVLKKVKDLVVALDVSARHMRLRVTFFESSDVHRANLSLRWRYAGDGYAIGTYPGRPDEEGFSGVMLPGGTWKKTTSVSSQDLLVMSGESGWFVTGKSVPVRDEVILWLNRAGVVWRTVSFRDVSTGFMLTPTILDTKVRLEITPFISYFIDEEKGSIIYREAGTTIDVPVGDTVVIAEDQTDRGKFIGDILSGFYKSGVQGNFLISVTPSVEN